jgi:hypothetical protein
MNVVTMANTEIVKDASPSSASTSRRDNAVALRRKGTPTVLQLIALTAGIALALFVFEGHTGLNLPDEGFFWYGVQRVLHGEIPIRDFQAYDPGRYYWSAMFLAATTGTSVVALRATVQIFGWIGLFAGVWLIHRSAVKRDPVLWALAVITLAIWMSPWFKAFDNTIPILVVCALANLLRQPLPRSYFVAGLSVGFGAVIGRNHGIYGIIACMGAMTYLTFKLRRLPTFLEFGAGCAGVVVGAAPTLAMLSIPGFATAFLDSIRLLFQAHATNFPLPVPYPWLVSFARPSIFDITSDVLLGTLFLWLIAFPLLGISCAVSKLWRGSAPARPEFVAALLVSVPYMHYAFSRADVVHMAVSATPMALACFIAISRVNAWARYPLAALLCGISIVVAGPSHAGWQCLETQCTVETVGTDKLQVTPGTVNDLALLDRLIHDFAANGQSYYVTPYWPGAYAVFDAKSPTWATYALWSYSAAFQQLENARLAAAHPAFVLINDWPLDGRPGQEFSHTNALTYNYVKTHFRAVANYKGLPAGYELYVPR